MIKRLFLAMALVCATVVSFGPTADAAPGYCGKRSQVDTKSVMNCVTLENVRLHQAAFQRFADEAGGNRVAGSPGYVASRNYVKSLLEKAGYKVTLQKFDFAFYQELSDAELEQVAPNPTVYLLGDRTGFASMVYTGSGDVTAETQAVDWIDPTGKPANTSNSGCEPEDFADFVAGRIAVLQRGSCSFAIKAANAEAAGAVGVIVANEGQEDRTEAFVGTLSNPGSTIPVVGTAYAVGLELGQPGVTARIKTDALSEIRTTENVIADSPWAKSDDNVVMVGAHLDSVAGGPGINDNGSGSAAVLEVALQMAKAKTRNHVRFAWWSAEEFGLVGSEYYVENLPQADRDKIAAYLNFDMVASPNYMFGIYDGDDSDGEGAGPGPEGSAAIEASFIEYFDSVDQPHKGVDFTGRSDYGPFIAIGVPAGGLFTGAEDIKTEADVELFGGTAGQPYDSCYHQACDTYDNNNEFALDINADAIAYVTVTYANAKQSKSRGPSKANPKAKKGLGHNPHHNGLPYSRS